MKILLIEDTDIYIQTLQRVTMILDYQLIVAETGERGLQLLSDEPDLVIVDIGLPDIDGIALVRNLRKSAPNTPIVALTAHVLEGEKERALEAGCDQYVPKPVEIPFLLELLKSYES